MKVRTLLEITNQVPAKKTAVQEKFKVQINVVIAKTVSDSSTTKQWELPLYQICSKKEILKQKETLEKYLKGEI